MGNFRLADAVEEVYVEHYLSKYAWSDYSFSSFMSKFDDICAMGHHQYLNTLLSSWNLQSRNIDYNVTFNGFEMYLLINLFDSTTRVKDRDELLLNF